MSLASIARWLGNGLYKGAFPIYRPLYSAFKSYGDKCERNLLAEQISPGSVVVDAGANIGVFSQFLAKCVGRTGKVHSFEPDPANFARLRAAVSSLPNVHPNQLAVSDRTGSATLHVSDNLNVDHRAYPTEGEMRRTVTIQAIRLDDYFKSGDRVDVIKIDIQGFELHALRGAQRVLEDNPDIKMLFEYWPYGLRLAGSSGLELASFLQERGFTLSRIERSGLIPWETAMDDDCAPSNYSNVFAERAASKT